LVILVFYGGENEGLFLSYPFIIEHVDKLVPVSLLNAHELGCKHVSLRLNILRRTPMVRACCRVLLYPGFLRNAALPKSQNHFSAPLSARYIFH